MMLKLMSDNPYLLDDNPLKLCKIMDKVLAVDFRQPIAGKGVLAIYFEPDFEPTGMIRNFGNNVTLAEDEWIMDANAYLLTKDGKTIQQFRHISAYEMERWDQPIESLDFLSHLNSKLKNLDINYVGDLIRLTEKEFAGYTRSNDDISKLLSEVGLRFGTNVGDWLNPHEILHYAGSGY